MKRLSLFVLIAALIAGTVFAQDKDARPDRNNRQDRIERYDPNNRQNEVKSVTIEGTLQLEKGSIAVKSGDSVYYVPMLMRYIGFIDGLKEGARVSVEGFEARNFIRPSKVTIAGKAYDFAAGGRGPGFMNSLGPDQRRGDFGPGGCGMQGFGRRNGPQRGCRGWV